MKYFMFIVILLRKAASNDIRNRKKYLKKLNIV